MKSGNSRYISHTDPYGELKTVALLIEKGACVNAVTTDNETPLHLASKRGDIKTSRFTNRERSIC
jgi:ankyrin repeat protein